MSEVSALPNGWQLVVGLEVHVELATKTKMFSASANRFGDEPNTNIDPVTLGLPGALPVLNKHAIELASETRFGLGAAIFSANVAKAQRIAIEDIEAGCVAINDFVRSDPRVPFGGIKDSGYGRELGKLGIHEFINSKSIVGA